MRDTGPTEIGGFGITPSDDPLLIEDIRLVTQQTTEVSVAFDDETTAYKPRYPTPREAAHSNSSVRWLTSRMRNGPGIWSS
jgi:hypothetical protein